MKVLFINSKQKKCGVYQYGLRLWCIVKKSFFDIEYHEISESADFLKLDFTDVDILFLNWIEVASTGPFAWFDFHTYDFLKSLDIKVVSVQHTKNCFTKSSKFVCCNIQDTSIKSILRAYNSPKTLDYISIDLSHM